VLTKEQQEYFDKIESELNIKLTDGQKAWYIKKAETQKENMTREYPSTPEESFLSANEGLYWGQQMTKARMEKRICNVPHDEHALTFSSWDIGIGDSTAIWV
jgi:hypothetical protein